MPIFVILGMIYLAVFGFVLGLMPPEWEKRPTLQPFGADLFQKKTRKRYKA